MFSHFAINGVLIGSLMSAVVHAGAGGGLYYWFAKSQPPPIVAELDLSMVPLVPVIPNPGGGSGMKEQEVWMTPKKGKEAPLPQVPRKVETKEEVVKQEAFASPCNGPCPDDPVVGQGWGGGTGEGEGRFVPAEETSRKPRWIKNFITSSDYPLIARQEGKDGRVVLTVFIDAEGRVRDARLLQGSYEMLNEVALRKVKEAIFSPAYDENRKPVSCKVTLPIRFKLQ